jgi:hypothetical protein
MNLLRKLVLLFGLSSAAAACEQAPERKADWPALPTTGFIVGRPATLDDMKLGNAAFTLDGKSAGALSIKIPQYVWWSDENGAKHPMFLVQGEEAPDGTKIVGLRDFEGNETVATLAELELLGMKKPE